jgi:hypothetical protein
MFLNKITKSVPFEGFGVGAIKNYRRFYVVFSTVHI